MPTRTAARSGRGGRIKRVGWTLIVGVALCVAAVAWWAASYSEITSRTGNTLTDATSCLAFRGAYCEALIEAPEAAADTAEDVAADAIREIAETIGAAFIALYDRIEEAPADLRGDIEATAAPFLAMLQRADAIDQAADALIAENALSVPVYYHFYTLWPGLFLIAIGLWRMTPLSVNPPDWFLPYRIPLFRILALLVLILVWWEAAARAGPNLLADPASTLAAAIDMFGEDRNRLRVGFFDSLRVYLSGFGLATLIGIPIGLIFGGFRILGQTMEVFMNALMATPRIAFIPLIIVFLGLGYEAKTFVVFLGAVMPIMVNTYAGVRNSDGELVEMARSAGARRGQIFIRILLPGALPFIVVGLRIGATIGLINTVVAEIYLAASGLGGLIGTYRAAFSPPNYLVVVLCLSLIGVVVTSLLRILESRTERWRYNGN